ncbi:allatostatin-A-like [Teleopsis dalmanni]|uniref:allatostatin-A-like n=1 Tax=Teleopsis dalmanni TaxID=139649 RepID=UPI0018CFDF40|nr:allatostatin-A-like [Teleopsis dalmanni]
MNILHATTLLLLSLFCLSFACGEPTFPEGNNPRGNPSTNQQNTLFSEADLDSRNSGDIDSSNYDKRVERYAFGLGRRAYTYTTGPNGVKRLPVYNFGLGKRARPYSFGLGKRADYEDEEIDFDPAYLAFMDEKRNRPYSFGLGKRERRDQASRYGFGLGRR